MSPVPEDLPLADKRWRLGAAAVRQQSPVVKLAADAGERAAVAAALDLLDCPALVLEAEIRPLAGRRFRLTGRLTAEVVQACVVSLAPVPAAIVAPLDLELWPADEIPVEDHEVEIDDPDAPDPPQPIHDNVIDLGTIAYEALALALEPYPRHPDAALAAALPEEQPPSPFAVLGKLRKPDGEA